MIHRLGFRAKEPSSLEKVTVQLLKYNKIIL